MKQYYDLFIINKVITKQVNDCGVYVSIALYLASGYTLSTFVPALYLNCLTVFPYMFLCNNTQNNTMPTWYLS